jgi:hypothetical protein
VPAHFAKVCCWGNLSDKDYCVLLAGENLRVSAEADIASELMMIIEFASQWQSTSRQKDRPKAVSVVVKFVQQPRSAVWLEGLVPCACCAAVGWPCICF